MREFDEKIPYSTLEAETRFDSISFFKTYKNHPRSFATFINLARVIKLYHK